jgi:flagellar protein FlaG
MGIGPFHPNDLNLNIAHVSEPSQRIPERIEIIQAVKAVNKTEMFGQENEVRYVLDQDSRKVLVRIVNKTTDEVVRQIPAEYLLKIASELKQK